LYCFQQKYVLVSGALLSFSLKMRGQKKERSELIPLMNTERTHTRLCMSTHIKEKENGRREKGKPGKRRRRRRRKKRWWQKKEPPPQKKEQRQI
jgi:hypothetical protein